MVSSAVELKSSCTAHGMIGAGGNSGRFCCNVSSESQYCRPDMIILIAPVVRTTVLHDLSVLAVRRTMQINSRPTEYIFGNRVAICVGDVFD